jgi:hypothetical protein
VFFVGWMVVLYVFVMFFCMGVAFFFFFFFFFFFCSVFFFIKKKLHFLSFLLFRHWIDSFFLSKQS